MYFLDDYSVFLNKK